MSRHERESGEIVIPSSQWADFKKSIRDAMNLSSAKRLSLALQLHERLKSTGAGRGKDRISDRAWEFVNSLNTGGMYSTRKYSVDDMYSAVSAVVKEEYRPGKPSRQSIRKPLKKDFPQYGNTATDFSLGEASLRFDNERRLVKWDVSENNHAVENARENDLGRAFFSALRTVKWTKNSGGSIVGNDEYNRAADYEGGGGNYAKERFGADDVPFSFGRWS